MSMDRRTFMLRTAAAAAAQAGLGAADAQAAQSSANPKAGAGGAASRPNIILYIADEYRWDFVGANRLNSTTHTPNLDAMANNGVTFTQAITNEPVCGPSRAVMMTSRYATENGVWGNNMTMDASLPTLAGTLRSAGYTANLVGKWHLAPEKASEGGGYGFVEPKYRGGFLDFWEGANLLEFTSHPYYGTIWNGDGKAITWKDQYRVDFLTDIAVNFLRQKHEKPFFLYISQLEPHQQNDMLWEGSRLVKTDKATYHGPRGAMVAPKGAAARFQNPYIPPDLRALPGGWQVELPDYYGCCEAIDTSIGRVRKVLEEEGLAGNTIILFTSDHGCHFRTRNKVFKQSPHNSSIRIPLVMEGPGVDQGQRIDELVSNMDTAPTILDLAGVPPAPGMRGKSIVPLIHSAKARKEWPKKKLVQISGPALGRAIRTPEWTYCVAVRHAKTTHIPNNDSYSEYQMYNQYDDPAELVNLAGRQEFEKQASALREELVQLIVDSGEPAPTIERAELYP